MIIGDQQTGKTAIAIDTILSQKLTNKRERHVATGQKRSTVAQLAQILTKNDVVQYSFLVAASASGPALIQFLALHRMCHFRVLQRQLGNVQAFINRGARLTEVLKQSRFVPLPQETMQQYTYLVAATASDPALIQFLAPYS
ncbi:hypothetical protein MKW92_027458 [Papaver armeniacum]|nr:hypothetical protein MKW92_027458 [Papaver armeniacum]